jgi:hypothetical protein
MARVMAFWQAAMTCLTRSFSSSSSGVVMAVVFGCGRRSADRLAGRREALRQTFRLTAAARAELDAEDRGSAGKAEIATQQIGGQPHLEAPARRVAGQIARRLGRRRVTAALDFGRYFDW